MDNLILVNRENGIDKDYVPNDLIICDNNENNFHKYLDPKLKPMIKKEVYLNFLKLKRDAMMHDFEIIIDSAYRSYDYQNQIWKKVFDDNFREMTFNYPYLNSLEIFDKSYKETSNIVAHPGHSEHQTGLAFDVGCLRAGKYYDEIKDTPECLWLIENAHKYGFILRYPKGKEKITGYNYEPWHFRYIGLPYSIECHDKGYTLEEYHKLVLKK